MLSNTTVSQNSSSQVTDDAANKVIELYVAFLAMTFGSNIALDHPVHSKGDNPDVILDFRGQRWALALKTLHSRKPRTIYDNIKKAADQIAASFATHGLVVLNVKNLQTTTRSGPRRPHRFPSRWQLNICRTSARASRQHHQGPRRDTHHGLAERSSSLRKGHAAHRVRRSGGCFIDSVHKTVNRLSNDARPIQSVSPGAIRPAICAKGQQSNTMQFDGSSTTTACSQH